MKAPRMIPAIFVFLFSLWILACQDDSSVIWDDQPPPDDEYISDYDGSRYFPMKIGDWMVFKKRVILPSGRDSSNVYHHLAVADEYELDGKTGHTIIDSMSGYRYYCLSVQTYQFYVSTDTLFYYDDDDPFLEQYDYWLPYKILNPNRTGQSTGGTTLDRDLLSAGHPRHTIQKGFVYLEVNDVYYDSCLLIQYALHRELNGMTYVYPVRDCYYALDIGLIRFDDYFLNYTQPPPSPPIPAAVHERYFNGEQWP